MPSESEELHALKKLLRKYNIYCLKIHQSAYQERGIPDLLCCISGVFVGIEGKILTGNKLLYTEHQLMHLSNIRKAGGIGVGVAINPNNPREQKWALDLVTSGEASHLQWTSFTALATSIHALPERLIASWKTEHSSSLNPADNYLAANPSVVEVLRRYF